MRTNITAFILAVLVHMPLMAQSTVSGTVSDSADGTPLEGVTVTVAGTGLRAVSDAAGAFSVTTTSGVNVPLKFDELAPVLPVRVMDMRGHVIGTDVSALPVGMYLVEYRIAGTTLLEALVVTGAATQRSSLKRSAAVQADVVVLVFSNTGYVEKMVNAADGASGLDVQMVALTAGHAVFNGDVLSGTVDLSGLTYGTNTTDIEIMVCPAEGDTTTPTWPALPGTDNSTSSLCNPGAFINGFDPVIPVANLASAVTVDRIPLPGQYRVWTRELDDGTPVSAWTPSAPATVSHTAGAYGKSWYAEVAALTGPDALGTTVGRTSTAALTLIDPATMSDTEVRAALPSGWTFNRNTNSALEPPAAADAASPAVLENYELRNVRIRMRGGRDHVHVRQCLIYPSDLGNPFLMVERGARLHDFSNNTVIGPQTFGGTGQVVQCQYPLNSGQGRGIVDLISYNMFSGIHGDNCSVTGSPVTRTAPDPDGTWLHHNLFDAEGFATGGPAEWWVGTSAPHADGVTFKGAYDNGIHCNNNVFWQVPVEPITISAALATDGVVKIAGAARPYAGSRGGTATNYYKLGDVGIAGQNNMVRIVQDNAQYVDSTTWAGPVRLTRFLQTKWAGMAGHTMALSSAAQAGKDVAIYDGIASPGSNLGYIKTRFLELERTTLEAYFGMPAPTGWGYFGEIVNFWTGEAAESTGSPGSLAAPL